MFIIPENFAREMIALGGAKGRAWLDHLPTILAKCEQRWEITIGPPFDLSFNYVAPAIRSDGTPVVVKAFLPIGDESPQAEAPRLFDGHGMVQLLAYDESDEVMLLERILPGTLLSTLEDDEQATSIAASVMRNMWRPAPLDHPFSSVSKWGQGFVRLRNHYGGGNGPFPPALLTKAEKLFAKLTNSMAEPVLLHGDLHHENILAATREPWLAIDPKGLIGEPAYETGALLRNQLSVVFEASQPVRVMARRVDQLSAELGLDRARICDWGLAQAVLSAWWNIEDFGEMDEGGEGVLACAELLAKIKV
ncbi:MAG: aminoglycoside phosphotransferase family protein [Chloroflexota bacterium]|nr:aminoglycoside phosphotransferase family protein [Chloroflexota bacterium]